MSLLPARACTGGKQSQDQKAGMESRCLVMVVCRKSAQVPKMFTEQQLLKTEVWVTTLKILTFFPLTQSSHFPLCTGLTHCAVCPDCKHTFFTWAAASSLLCYHKVSSMEQVSSMHLLSFMSCLSWDPSRSSTPTSQEPHLSLTPDSLSAASGLWQGRPGRTQPWISDATLLLQEGPFPLLTVALPSTRHPEG